MKTWSHAFIAQAQSDLAAYQHLVPTTLPSCHRLHYLQMWLEKLCKAYLWLPDAVQEGEDLRWKHKVVEKVLPRLVVEHWRRMDFRCRPDLAPLREICREVDRLHPQIDDFGRRGDNVEYPWLGVSGEFEAPACWRFRLTARLHQAHGRLLLKAATVLTRNPAVFIPPRADK